MREYVVEARSATDLQLALSCVFFEIACSISVMIARDTGNLGVERD